MKQAYIYRKNSITPATAMISRIRLTASEPTFLPADSNAMLVIVQKTAVSKADSSPV